MIKMNKIIWLLAFSMMCVSCGTSRVRSSEADPAEAARNAALAEEQRWGDSSLDINYTLGHLRRKIHMESQGNQIVAQLLLDRTLMKQNSIDPPRYRDFMKKVEEFMNQKRSPSSEAVPTPECRSPFLVNLRSGKDTRILNGCRSSDESSFSHLVRDAEFLIYSQR